MTPAEAGGSAVFFLSLLTIFLAWRAEVTIKSFIGMCLEKRRFRGVPAAWGFVCGACDELVTQTMQPVFMRKQAEGNKWSPVYICAECVDRLDEAYLHKLNHDANRALVSSSGATN